VRLADGEIGAAEATRAYHADLDQMGLRPHRPLEKDLEHWKGLARIPIAGIAPALEPAGARRPPGEEAATSVRGRAVV
jgi:hypothetical protein